MWGSDEEWQELLGEMTLRELRELIEWGSCDGCGAHRYCSVCGASRGGEHRPLCPVPDVLNKALL